MRDRELYATILGVQAPWTVERVELDVAGGAVHVWLTIDWLREAAVTAVARQLKLGWDAVCGIERRAVARGLERRGTTLTLRPVGVDEKSFQRRHDYVTVVSDLEGARVLFVADDRKRESLEAFWALGLTAAQRAQVEAIAAPPSAPRPRRLP